MQSKAGEPFSNLLFREKSYTAHVKKGKFNKRMLTFD